MDSVNEWTLTRQDKDWTWMQNQIIILTALTAGRFHSWGGSEKQALNLSSDRKSLAAREPESGGRFFRARAVRFMFRARPFVIMAECKQTDIIWRLLHHYQDLPLLHVQNWQKKKHPEKAGEAFRIYIKGVALNWNESFVIISKPWLTLRKI